MKTVHWENRNFNTICIWHVRHFVYLCQEISYLPVALLLASATKIIPVRNRKNLVILGRRPDQMLPDKTQFCQQGLAKYITITKPSITTSVTWIASR